MRVIIQGIGISGVIFIGAIALIHQIDKVLIALHGFGGS